MEQKTRIFLLEWCPRIPLQDTNPTFLLQIYNFFFYCHAQLWIQAPPCIFLYNFFYILYIDTHIPDPQLAVKKL